MPNTVRTGYSVKFALSEPVIKVNANTVGTEIDFGVTTAVGASMVIFHRLLGVTAWTANDPTNTPVVGTEIKVDNLVADSTYQFMPIGYGESDGRGTPSDPGSILQVTTRDTSGELAISGSFMSPINRLRTLLANSVTFQAMVGANNAEEAKALIFLITVIDSELPRDGTTGRLNNTFAVVDWDGGYDADNVSGGGSYHYKSSGTLYWRLTGPVPEAYQAPEQYKNAVIWFYNRVGVIHDEMKALAGSSDYLTARNFKVVEGPFQSTHGELKTQGQYWESKNQVTWGI